LLCKVAATADSPWQPQHQQQPSVLKCASGTARKVLRSWVGPGWWMIEHDNDKLRLKLAGLHNDIMQSW
jgi:hypothetical protein